MNNQLNTVNKILNWLEEYDTFFNEDNYTFSAENGLIKVSSLKNVNIANKNLESIPVFFNRVEGTFNCSNNQLKSLQGCPKIVKLEFLCSKNKIKNFNFSPYWVGDDFLCSNNEIEDLNLNCEIQGSLYISNNPIKTIHHFQAFKVKGYIFDISKEKKIDLLKNLYIYNDNKNRNELIIKGSELQNKILNPFILKLQLENDLIEKNQGTKTKI